MFDVITIGAATHDVFLESEGFHLMPGPRRQGTYECFPLGAKVNVEGIHFATGGGATNAAATFRHLGFRTAVITRVGDDTAGEIIRNDLRMRGISRRMVRTIRGGTSGYATILLTPHGDRTALVYRGVSAHFSAADVPWGSLQAKCIFATSLAGNVGLLRRLCDTASARGIRFAFNPGMQELQWGLARLHAHCGKAHVLFLNRAEAEFLAQGERDMKKIRSIIASYFRHAVVVTDAARGAFYWDQSTFLHASSKKVAVVNSTGAGDAFGSGFVSGILRWQDPLRALQLGTLNAIGTIQAMGAKKGLLSRWPSPHALSTVSVRQP